MIPGTIWWFVRFWSQQLHEALYISDPSNSLRHCTSLSAVTTWENVHLSSQNYLFSVHFYSTQYVKQCWSFFPNITQKIFISVPISYMWHCNSLVSTNTYDIVYHYSQQILDYLFITWTKKYLRHCIFFVPATIWDTAHLWFKHQPDTLYISGSSKFLWHCTSMVPATTWVPVHLWSEKLLGKLYI